MSRAIVSICFTTGRHRSCVTVTDVHRCIILEGHSHCINVMGRDQSIIGCV